MNVSSVNATRAENKAPAAGNGSNPRLIGEKGRIVEGVISNVSDEISINFNGTEVKASKSAVRNAREGEIRRFEIMDVSDRGIVLRELGNSHSSEKNNGILCTVVDTDQTRFADQLARTSDGTEEDAEEEEKLKDIGSRMTGDDYSDLEQEGMSLEKYNLDRLQRALNRIKIQKSLKEDSIENQVEKKKADREQIERASIAGVIRNPGDRLIAMKLLEADLPVTSANIEKIGKAAELSAAAGSMSDQSMKYLIHNNLEPTVENIYRAKYAGHSSRYADYNGSGLSYKNSYAAYTSSYGTAQESAGRDVSAWNEIKPQALKVIEDAGMPVNEDTAEQAKWLYDNDLPITEETLKSLETLRGINESYSTEQALDRIVYAYQQGIVPEQASLGQYSITIDQITSRRQLEEIRLKMTSEAGQSLLAKGIEINTEELQRVVESLKELEREYYQSLLKEADVPVTDENRELLRNTVEKVNELKASPSYVLGATFYTRHLQTVEGLHQEAEGLKGRLDKAGALYDALMTAPRTDMGDSIQKAFRNVDSLLEGMDLELTEANRRAVKILGYNRMEINEENISLMKNYDSQVNTLLKEMHPAAAVWMIKSGVNPLDTPIEELNLKLDGMKKELGITEEEKYSRFLWKLDKENALSPDERKAFIGIYRLLHNVEKSDGAAVGAVLNAGRKVTLNHLLTAVRTRKNKGIDENIDDSFGEIARLTSNSESISDQVAYFSRVIHDVKDSLELFRWNQVTGDGKDFNDRMNLFLNQSVESIRENLSAAEEDQELNRAYVEERLSGIRQLAAEGQEEAARFLSGYGQPVTIENVAAAVSYMTGTGNLFRDLKGGAKRLEKSEALELDRTMEDMGIDFDDPDKLEQDFNKLEKGIETILNRACEDPAITAQDIASLKRLGTGMKLAKSLIREECYEIPLPVEGGITNINLMIVRGEKDTGRVHIGMESERLGKMEAEFQIKGRTIRGYVLCDNREGLQAFKEEKENLEDAMEGLELNVSQLDFGMDRNRKAKFVHTGTKGDAAETKTLYQAAKVFIKTIKTAESKTLERFGASYDN